MTVLGSCEAKANVVCASRRRDEGRSRFPHGDGGETENELVEKRRLCQGQMGRSVAGLFACDRLYFRDAAERVSWLLERS